MGKSVLITGGTSGIGKAIVKKILAESQCADDRVFVVYGHSDEAAAALKREHAEDSDKLFVIKADLSDYCGIDVVRNAVQQQTSTLDWIILNTGVGSYKKFDEYTPELWEQVMRTNVNVPAFIVKEMKEMINDNGAILFMGSHAGQTPYSSSLVYSVSKSAVLFMAQSMVKLFDDRGIRVNAIAPGFIETRWQDGRTDESRERINRKIAAHRFGTPEEVADLCYHVLTNEYLNGSIYDIHGGYDFF